MTGMTWEGKEGDLANLHVGVWAINEPRLGPLTVRIWHDYSPGENL